MTKLITQQYCVLQTFLEGEKRKSKRNINIKNIIIMYNLLFYLINIYYIMANNNNEKMLFRPVIFAAILVHPISAFKKKM